MTISLTFTEAVQKFSQMLFTQVKPVKINFKGDYKCLARGKACRECGDYDHFRISVPGFVVMAEAGVLLVVAEVLLVEEEVLLVVVDVLLVEAEVLLVVVDVLLVEAYFNEDLVEQERQTMWLA